MLATCASLTLIGSGCGDDGNGNGNGDDALFEALERAGQAGEELGVRFTFRVTVTGGADAIRARGYGQIEPDAQRVRTVTVAADERIESFTDEPFELARIDPAIALQVDNPIPRGTRWIKVDQDKLAEAAGAAELRRLQNPNPAEGLKLLKDLKPKIEDAGPERIDGVQTKRYRVTTTIGRILDVIGERGAELPGCPSSVGDITVQYVYWIDDEDLLRRYRFRLEPKGKPATVVTTSVTGYDRTLSVDVPDQSIVYDATEEFVDQAGRQLDDDCLPDDETRLVSTSSGQPALDDDL